MLGNLIIVDMNPKKNASTISKHVWRGKVSEPTRATRIGIVNIMVDRLQKKGVVTNKTKYNKLALSRLRIMSDYKLLE